MTYKVGRGSDGALLFFSLENAVYVDRLGSLAQLFGNLTAFLRHMGKEVETKL